MIMKSDVAHSLDDWRAEVKVHAFLGLVGWGFLIPFSILTFSHLSNRNAKQFHRGTHLHMSVATLGLLCALAGVGYALLRFGTPFHNSDEEPTLKATYRKVHKTCGLIASIGAIAQVLLMGLMRRPLLYGQSISSLSTMARTGHILHKTLGYLWLALAWVALETGTHMVGGDDALIYSAGLIGSVLAVAVAVVATVQLSLHHDDGCDDRNSDLTRPENPTDTEPLQQAGSKDASSIYGSV